MFRFWSVLLLLAAPCVMAQENINLYAAGSLRPALTDAARAFGMGQPDAKVVPVYGASGLLLERIKGGEPAQVFASANMEHPRALAAGGAWEPARAFARNALCLLAQPLVGLRPDNMVSTLLDPSVRVGTSTPKADPSGDYAFEMFARIGSSSEAPAGAQSALEGKALQLTGGPNSAPPPPGRSVYGVLVAQGQADVFVTYCTNAVVAAAEQPGLQVVEVPPAYNVTADYGLTVRKDAPRAAKAFAQFLLSPDGQAILRRHGFKDPGG